MALQALLAGALGLSAVAAPVRFKSLDGVELVADYLAPKKGRPALVLLHGVAAGRGEWSGLAGRLAKKGYGSLAVDFRGHGESGGPGFATFRGAKDWAALEQDVRAAVRFLAGRGVPRARAGLLGASLGANLAARAAAKEGELACVLLLSPGIEYQGVEVEEAALKVSRPLLLAASPGDRYAFETVRYLRPRLPAAAVLQASGGHGAQMLGDETFAGGLLSWVEERCSGNGAVAPSPASREREARPRPSSAPTPRPSGSPASP